MFPLSNEDAGESPLGAILMIAITVMLFLLILLMAMQLPSLWYDPTVPDIFMIDHIRHVNGHGVLNYDSYMVIKNGGTVAYDNRNLYAKTYRNGVHLPSDIPTMNGHAFLPTHHDGIQTLGGFGSDDFLWYPDATLAIDFSDGTFHPGDIVQFDVYDKTTDQLISRDTYPHTNGIQERCMRLYFNHQDT
jgi:hypothetical protein